MSDIELVKACAELMGGIATELPDFDGLWLVGNNSYSYDPLHNDEQCFALVKRFGLCISRLSETWYVDASDDGDAATANHPADLNRAICECVSKLKAPA